ncbi:MAG TPA: hypothetical protein VJO16_06900 [Candidatus Acidoferrum sp.]|nr:hypothetical protein [Candidatus Acidoferrum sp.]
MKRLLASNWILFVQHQEEIIYAILGATGNTGSVIAGDRSMGANASAWSDG